MSAHLSQSDWQKLIGKLDLSRVKISKSAKEVLADIEQPKPPPSKADGDGMNKTERLYQWELEDRKKRGEIISWYREPISMVVIDAAKKGRRAKVRYRPDFMVVLLDGKIEFHEIKGFLRDDARKTYLAAVERYPCFTFRMIRRAKGGWEEIL